MTISSIKTTLPYNVEKVWEIMTSLEDCAWRSDLDRVEITGETQFIEVTREGFETTFTITSKVPCERWEFDMENANMKGHWTGIFTQTDEGTELELIEDVSPKKLIMKPFVKSYLKKQQAQYLADLEAALSS